MVSEIEMRLLLLRFLSNYVIGMNFNYVLDYVSHDNVEIHAVR